MDLNSNPALLFFARLIDLIALPIDLFRAGHWPAALAALLLQLVLLGVIVFLSGLVVVRRYKRKGKV